MIIKVSQKNRFKDENNAVTDIRSELRKEKQDLIDLFRKRVDVAYDVKAKRLLRPRYR